MASCDGWESCCYRCQYTCQECERQQCKNRAEACNDTCHRFKEIDDDLPNLRQAN